MALNIKLRNSASLIQIADDVAVNGNFALTVGRFYYSYINKRGQGIILASLNGGRSWFHYDNLGPISSISARGPWIAWSEGPRAVLYDVAQQWRIVDAQPFENISAVSDVTPLPEINSIRYRPSPLTGNPTPSVATKPVTRFGLWDQPAGSVSLSGSYDFGFVTWQRTPLGVFGDNQRMGSGIDHIREVYLYETWYLGSPAASHVQTFRRTSATAGVPGATSDAWESVPDGPLMVSGLGTKGFEGTLTGVTGIMGSQMRGPPGIGTHGRGIPPSLYTMRMEGMQVGLRGYDDLRSSEHEWAHGGAWVDEYDVTAASGSIGGAKGLVFCDSAGNIAMVKRSGSRFGSWSEAKSYGNPGFRPSSMWLPHTYGTVRAGVMGNGEAWFLIDDAPDFIPRGRLVDDDYIANDAPTSRVKDGMRKVTFW